MQMRTALLNSSATGLQLPAVPSVDRAGDRSRLHLTQTDGTVLDRPRGLNSDRFVLESDEDDVAEAQVATPKSVRDDPGVWPNLVDLSVVPRVNFKACTNEVLYGNVIFLMQAMACSGRKVSTDILCGPRHLWLLWPRRLRRCSLLRRFFADTPAGTHA